MIKRIVKMTFRPNQSAYFEQLFDERKEKIRSFPGCLQLELVKEKDTAVFFTISIWDEPQSLENYRHSDLFKSTWAVVKPLFEKRAEAWTTESIALLPSK